MVGQFGGVLGRVFNTPLLYDERKAETVALALGPRLTGSQVVFDNGSGPIDHIAFEHGRPSAGKVGDRLGRVFDKHQIAPFDIVEGVAIIPIEGTLVHKGGWVGASSGQTSYQGLQVQLTRALARSDVKGVVFEVDSYGGEVAGAFETAELLHKLSRAKPTLAILTDFAFSAGYLMASQARQIVMPEFGGAGSIGVITMHADFSKNLDQEGIRVTIQKSGAHKADGNPFEPLAPEVAARTQIRIDAMREKFAEAVGRGRGRRLTKTAAVKTEAQTYLADEAVDLGLADGIGNAVEVFNAFVEEVNRR
jgi:signal peptide peptidase SppA